MIEGGLVGLACGQAQAQLAGGEPSAQLQMSQWVGGVANATDIAFLTDGRAVVTRQTGEVVLVSPAGAVMNASAAKFAVRMSDETGLLGVVREETSDTLYFYASTGPDYADTHRIYRGTVSAGGAITVDMARPIVTGGLAGQVNHVGGGMVIYKGQLYVCLL
jgi:glucose/arabinose dehydrogenase